MYNFIVVFFCSIIFSLFSERGIVVALNDRYVRNFFLASLIHLRVNLQCKLPLEIWHSGDELSDSMKKQLGKHSNITFRDIAEELHVDPTLYRGWHIKPQIIALSRFDEVILMDADLFFFADPELLFSESGYQRTGAFFFCDFPHLFPISNSEIFTLERYLDRRSFIQSLINFPSMSVPKDVHEFWSQDIPSFSHPFIGDLQDSGCVVMDKKRHSESLQYIIALNTNRAETYRHIHGDKETFWLGCEMAQVPYHMNEQRPHSLRAGKQFVPIVQFLNDKLFYQQKKPEYSKEKMTFYYNGSKKALSAQEKESIRQAYKVRRQLEKQS
jgi:hypothetical protein